MDEAVNRCIYDRAHCRAVWQRVAPNAAYPSQEEAAPPDPGASDALSLPGAQADPCCMGSAAETSLAVLQGFLREELGSAQVYACLARALPRPEGARLLRTMAEEEKRHARALSAAVYLVSGAPYCPRVCTGQPDTRDFCALLRRLYHEEACAGFNYARAAEETLDPCLAKLFAAMSADEYRHAESLMALLGRQLAR